MLLTIFNNLNLSDLNKIKQFTVILVASFSLNALAQSEGTSAVNSTATNSALSEGLVYKVLLYPEMDKKEAKEVPAEYVNRFGETRWRRDADSIQAHARSIGFKEAIAVPFYNNKRISMKKAIALEAELDGEYAFEKDQKKEDPQAAISKVSDMGGTLSPRWQEGLVYKVQFLTSKDPLPIGDGRLRNLGNIYLYEYNGLTTYTWGRTRLAREAARLQREMKRLGFEDAFVVHYYNGKRISLQEALSLRQKGHGKSSFNAKIVTDENLVFRVQVAASNVRLSLNHPSLKNFEDVSMYVHEGMYKYTVGETSSAAEARDLKKRLNLKGSADAFVVTFLKGERISSGEAGQ